MRTKRCPFHPKKEMKSKEQTIRGVDVVVFSCSECSFMIKVTKDMLKKLQESSDETIYTDSK